MAEAEATTAPSNSASLACGIAPPRNHGTVASVKEAIDPLSHLKKDAARISRPESPGSRSNARSCNIVHSKPVCTGTSHEKGFATPKTFQRVTPQNQTQKEYPMRVSGDHMKSRVDQLDTEASAVMRRLLPELPEARKALRNHGDQDLLQDAAHASGPQSRANAVQTAAYLP